MSPDCMPDKENAKADFDPIQRIAALEAELAEANAELARVQRHNIDCMDDIARYDKTERILVAQRNELAATVAGMTEAAHVTASMLVARRLDFEADEVLKPLANLPARAKAITNVIEKARKVVNAPLREHLCIQFPELSEARAELSDALKSID